MHGRKLVQSVDKLLTRECVLHKSRYFRSQQLWVVIDEHFISKLERHKPVWVVQKGTFDVYLQQRGQLIVTPADVYRWLGYFNQYWEDGIGILDEKRLHNLLHWLQDAEETTTKAEQGSSSVGQEIPFPIHKAEEAYQASEGRYALRDYEVL